MSLMEKFDTDLKGAMKSSDSLRVSVLRMAKAAAKNRQIEKGEALSDDEVQGLISSMIKQRRDSVEQFTRGGRPDLADKESREIEILQAYQPRQLTGEELDKLVRESIAASGAAGPQDMGKVMRVLMPRVKGIADGKTVNERVRELLER